MALSDSFWEKYERMSHQQKLNLSKLLRAQEEGGREELLAVIREISVGVGKEAPTAEHLASSEKAPTAENGEE